MSPSHHSHLRFKIVFLGDPGVGKTSLILRLTDDKYDPTAQIDPTCDIDRRTKTMEWKGQAHTLNFWDTAGEEMFRTMTSSYFRNADAVLLMFDLSRPDSFDNLRNQWYKDCLNYIPRATFFVVGNKSDLPQNVPEEEIREFIDSNGLHYITAAHNSPQQCLDDLQHELLGALRGNMLEEYDPLSPRKLRSSGPIMRRFKSFVRLVIPGSPSSQRSPNSPLD